MPPVSWPRKLHARSLAPPTPFSLGGHRRALRRRSLSMAVIASPANGDLRAEAPTLLGWAPIRRFSTRPISRTMLFPRARAQIQDTWHVLGLRGTASHDYEVTDLFVPEEYTTWRDSAADRRESGPLYNIPMLTLYGVGFSGV